MNEPKELADLLRDIDDPEKFRNRTIVLLWQVKEAVRANQKTLRWHWRSIVGLGAWMAAVSFYVAYKLNGG